MSPADIACHVAWMIWCHDAPPIPAEIGEDESAQISDAVADYDRGAITADEFIAIPAVVKLIELARIV